MKSVSKEARVLEIIMAPDNFFFFFYVFIMFMELGICKEAPTLLTFYFIVTLFQVRDKGRL